MTVAVYRVVSVVEIGSPDEVAGIAAGRVITGMASDWIGSPGDELEEESVGRNHTLGARVPDVPVAVGLPLPPRPAGVLSG